MQNFLKWAARLALLLGVASVVMLFLSGFGYKNDWWALRPAFTMLRYVVYVAGAACVLGLLSVLLGIKWGWRQSFVGLLAILMGGGAAAVPLGMRKVASEVPPIHDITTNTQSPPEFVAILPLRKDAPNPPEYLGGEVTTKQLEAYPDLKTIRVTQTGDQAYEAAVGAVEALGWELVDANQSDGRIEATETTRWYGFKDDVVIRIRDSGKVTEVDVRSKSRVGGSDLGLNAKRIRAFRDEMLKSLESNS